MGEGVHGGGGGGTIWAIKYLMCVLTSRIGINDTRPTAKKVPFTHLGFKYFLWEIFKNPFLNYNILYCL